MFGWNIIFQRKTVFSETSKLEFPFICVRYFIKECLYPPGVNLEYSQNFSTNNFMTKRVAWDYG